MAASRFQLGHFPLRGDLRPFIDRTKLEQIRNESYSTGDPFGRISRRVSKHHRLESSGEQT